jgi:hypothetical protein
MAVLPALDGQAPLDRDQFLELCQTNASGLWERVVNTCGDLAEQIDQLQGDLAEEQLHTQQQAGEEIRIMAERDQYARQVAQLVAQQGIGGRVTRKTVKLENPPMLDDGKAVRFDDWLVLIKQKLTENADHYDTPGLRIALVSGCTTGKAQRHMAPRLRDGAINKYKDSDEILEHLKVIYNDPNRLITAKNEFRQLSMRTSDQFHDFHSNFIYWASEAEIPETTWKDELYHRLTTELQKLTIPKSIDDSDFQEFSDYCSQTANRLEVIKKKFQRPPGQGQNSPSVNTPSTTPSNTGRARSATPRNATPKPKEEERGQKLSDQEFERYRKEGRCFGCGEQGHRKPDCPKPKPKPGPQVNALEAKENSDNEEQQESNAGKD